MESECTTMGRWLAPGREGRLMSLSLGPNHSPIFFRERMDEEGNECMGGNEPRWFSVCPRLHSFPTRGILTPGSPPRVRTPSAPSRLVYTAVDMCNELHLPRCSGLLHSPCPEWLGPSPASIHPKAGSSLCSLLG